MIFWISFIYLKNKFPTNVKVEVWLNKIQSRMRSSLRHFMSKAVITYEEKPREQWLFDYPAQVSLCGKFNL